MKDIGNILSLIKRILTRPRVFIKFTPIEGGQRLKQKKVLITGGTSGIGYAMAKKFISEGAIVVITGRDEKKVKEVRTTLGNQCYGLEFDITDFSSIESKYREASNFIKGEFDCLVCNAGISLHETSILDVTKEGLELQLNTNLKGAYLLSQTYLKELNDYTNKSILFISSERGMQCDDVTYGLSKAAINSLTKGISRRFYRKGLRCNAIAPGITASNMTQIDPKEDLYCDRLASGRFFVAEEIAEVAAFLLSDASLCISGEIIACDAGEYISSYI